jgi:hypothetical protein
VATTTNFIQSCLLSDVYYWCSACYPLCHCWYPLFLPAAGTHCFCQLCPRHSLFLSSRTSIKVLYWPLQALYKSIVSASAGADMWCLLPPFLYRAAFYQVYISGVAPAIHFFGSSPFAACFTPLLRCKLHFSSLLVPTASASTFPVHSLAPLSGAFSLIIHDYMYRANTFPCTSHGTQNSTPLGV